MQTAILKYSLKHQKTISAFFFSSDMVGVYDANTRTSKTVRLSQYSVSPAGFTCLQGSIASGTYCAYTRIGHLICVFMNDMPSLGTKGVLPEGYRPPTDIIGFGYIRGTNTSGQILVNSAGEVATWCNVNNTRYFSGSVCFVVEQHSVSQISNRVLLWSGTAGKGVEITIDSDYSFKEFKSFYCLTSIDKTIGLPLVRNSGIQQDQYLHGITGWDDGTTTWTLCGLIRINTETTATIVSMSKHQIDGGGGVAGNLLKLWGYY